MSDSIQKLALIRHARSAHIHTGWIDSAGFREWRDAYEAAGIHDDERVPAELERLVASADIVVSSDTPRAVATARMLAPDREIVTSPLLRELDLVGPNLGSVRLPLRAWAFAVGGRMLYQMARRQYPPASEAARIDEAADWLDELMKEHSMVLAVTHAMFRRRISARLLQSGWRAETEKRTMDHWSAWIFSRTR